MHGKTAIKINPSTLLITSVILFKYLTVEMAGIFVTELTEFETEIQLTRERVAHNLCKCNFCRFFRA